VWIAARSSLGCVERIAEMPRFREERLEVRRDGDAMKSFMWSSHVWMMLLNVFNDSTMI